MAEDARGHWITTGFELDEATDEQSFHPRAQEYRNWIEGDEANE
jgi:hypothetical protein